MKFLDYFKNKFLFIFINISVLILTAILLKALGVGDYSIVFILFINLISSVLFYVYDYINKRKYYKELFSNLKALDKKYLISEVLEEANFIEGKLLEKVILLSNKSMNDEIASFKNSSLEYREYIETWVHEIKTPISVVKLISENNSSNEFESIEEEVEKIEYYIEQSLFYARSNDLEKDYIIKKTDLKPLINDVIKRNMNSLIENKIKINIDLRNSIVYSDSKWLKFIINQITINSIKYMNKNFKEINIYSETSKDSIILNIKDNGMGINEKDIGKVFEKGYTGSNGRKFGKSTGIGLYLCKKLSQKLGINIVISSKEDVFTTVTLIFPINNMVTF